MKKFLESLSRILIALTIILGIVFSCYWLWNPGSKIKDGRFDLGKNGIWIQHGWLASDVWFKRNNRDKKKFRSSEKITKLFTQLKWYHIKFVYPHLCPTDYLGKIPSMNNEQTKLFCK